MLGTTLQLETALRLLEQQIPLVEAELLRGATPGLAPNLAELWKRRRLIRQIILNRRIEAAKKVVDLQRWRDGDGVLYQLSGLGQPAAGAALGAGRVSSSDLA
jgi:hypothetical protein